jgi:MoaA/NifB/PqqE/SkfB family radical SAM enzyme
MAGSEVGSYLASDDGLAARYAKIRRHARGIRISGYDITKRCNLRCEGCFFFEGELSSHYPEVKSDQDYDEFFRSEIERGVNVPHFAGAEPALVQDRLRLANRYWQRGLIYTTGTIAIDPEITFMIHVSLWGNPETDAALRGAPVFRKAVKNYAGDPRAVVMMTINRHNVDEVPTVVQACADAGMRLSFNHYSPSRQYIRKVDANDEHDSDTFRFSTREDNLMLGPTDFARVEDAVGQAVAKWPGTVIYSPYYNAWINDPNSRFDIDPDTGIARDCPILNMPYHRQYHVDFSYSDDECCVANIDCTNCRHYVSGYTKIMAERDAHFGTAEGFRGWVEVFDTWCRLHFPDWETLH